MADWLIDETPRVGAAAVEASFPDHDQRLRSGGKVNLAILLNDVVVRNTKKLFGGADVRLDAIVVHGLGPDDDGDFYQPATFRFGGIRDGDRLPIEPPGLLVFYGRPRHFVDINIMMSRDQGDSDALGDLLATRLNSTEWKAASGELLGLAAVAPPAAAVVAAMGAASVIGNLAADVLRQITGNTIGMYRTSYLQYLHRFGLGRHPETERYRQQDLEFWYEIVPDRKAAT